MKISLSPKVALIRGAAWHMAMRLSIKGLGLLNTVIMARLLAPADYGVVAMAMLVVVLIQTFLDFGVTTALLRKGAVSQDEVDSAWTLGVIQGIAVAVLLLILAPLSAFYFHEPRVQSVLCVLAICVGLSSAGNIGTVLAQKEFDFPLAFKMGVYGKIIGVLATIISGYFLRDYRALLIGVAAGYLSGFFLSYAMHPYRPRWNTSQIGEIWAVTKWLMFSGVGGFILRKSDELIAARLGTTTDYGLYNVGADLGLLPTSEVGPSLLRAFLPVLSSIQHDLERTKLAVIKAMSAVNTLTLPLGFGFAAVAVPATSLVLGSAWTNSAPFVAAFALAGAAQNLPASLNSLLILRGHTKIQSYQVWFEFLVFAVAALVLVPDHFLMGLVWARILGSIAATVAAIYSCRKYCGLHASLPLRTIGRPLAGAVLMHFLVSFIVMTVQAPILGLITGIMAGALFYTLWTAATWVWAGRPEGLESTIFDYFKSRR